MSASDGRAPGVKLDFEPIFTRSASKIEDKPVSSEAEPVSPKYSDDALALGFTRHYEQDIRYVARWGRWMYYDGSCWKEDAVHGVFDKCREICREASEECEAEQKHGLGKQLLSAKTVAAVARMASWDQRTAAVVDQWDSDPWLLNTPGGAIDLRTGEIRTNRRDDYCTKITGVAPGGSCPRWREFLKRVTDGDSDLEGFLQRMIGYCLTGQTGEECLFFLYGTGANGKSKFLSAIKGAMGNYCQAAPIDTFVASTSEHHPTDLAGLRGARLVTAVETEEGRRWAISKIKNLTGGDPVACRFMRQDFFEYVPQFKLIIAGNHKPSLRNVDEAVRRRFHLVPFQVTIPEAERDRELGTKLQAEWPGILQWAIDGATCWHLDGLNPPTVVKDATASYLADEDHVARWMEECCLIDKACSGKSKPLYDNYCHWCEATHEQLLTGKQFNEELDKRGFPVEHGHYGNFRPGIALRADVENKGGEGW
jgi:putative DNA primase/helicase